MLQLTESAAFLFRDGQNVREAPFRGTPSVRVITVTRKGGHIEVSAGRKQLLSYDDDSPLPGRTRFCLGGTLSRMALGPVLVEDLDRTRPAATRP
jgi:hypothetical protein